MTVTPSHSRSLRAVGIAGALLLAVPALAAAQAVPGKSGAPAKAGAKAARPAPARTEGASVASPEPLNTARSSARGAAWALPDADALVQRVFTRIVSHDRPGAVPIRDYQRRFVGREATLEAVRRFAGRDVALSPSAFTAVDGWGDAPTLTLPPCEGPLCEAPVNSIWLAITRIERGELPHELHVWYTTNFAAASPSGPQRNAYEFCERWLRVGGGWKYDGFVRVKSVRTE